MIFNGFVLRIKEDGEFKIYYNVLKCFKSYYNDM